MAYVLDAFIGPAETLKQQIIQLPNTRLILLEQEIAIAPMLYTIPHSKAISPFWHLTDELFQLGNQLSFVGLIGYFEIELFGGYGERAVVLWENQKATFGPAMAEDSSVLSNQLFALLGVQKQNKHDEFDALNLGRYRSSEEWLAAS